MFQTFPWRLLLLKLAAFFSFCGGPLLLADLLKPYDRWDHAMILCGAAGAAALVGIDIFAIFELMGGPSRPDEGRIRLGIGVGLVFVAWYTYASRRLFHLRPRADA